MESTSQMRSEPDYPVRFSVEYPERELNRGTTAFRLIVAIPILIVAASIGSLAPGEHGTWRLVGVTGGVLFLSPLLMIVFRQKYPRWWFDWNLELLRFSNRIGVYLALMDDRYPSTDDGQSVALDFPYPDVKQDINRWLPLVKWLLAIPPLHRARPALDRSHDLGDDRLVCDPVHRPLSPRPIQLRPRRPPVDQPRRRLRIHPRHQRAPAVPTRPVMPTIRGATGRRRGAGTRKTRRCRCRPLPAEHLHLEDVSAIDPARVVDATTSVSAAFLEHAPDAPAEEVAGQV